MIIKAAGILIVDGDGNALMLKRGPGGDAPGLWAIPGGRIEDGESAVQAAIRETAEEAGFVAKEADLIPWVRSLSPRLTTGPLPTAAPPETLSDVVQQAAAAEPVSDPPGTAIIPPDEVDFQTFLLKVSKHFIPDLGPEGEREMVAYAWAPVREPPQPLHPGADLALRRFRMTEREVAQAMAAGELTSPQELDNSALFTIRITGTGSSFRSRFNENVLRPTHWYLNQEFLDRCAGLPVILEHPPKAVLNSKEFKSRIIGTVMLAYIDGDEVWAIARILDAAAIALMKRDVVSTSPTVVWRDPEKDNARFQLSNGESLLVEGKPILLDHVAIVERGVWDKDGPPTGVESTHVTDKGEDEMKVNLKRIEGESDDAYNARVSEAEKLVATARADAESVTAKLQDQVNALAVVLEDANKRLDSLARADAEKEEEKRADARRRADAFAFGKRADGESDDEYKKRMDAEEKACADAEMESGEEPAMAMDKAKRRRADAEQEDEKVMADKKRGDAEQEASEKERADAAEVSLLKRRLDEMQAQIDARATRTDEEADKFLVAQARADEAYQPWGRAAPRPMDGESLLQYRRRLLEGVQEHTAYKEVNLRAIAADAAAFGVIEGQIISEAAKVGRSPASVPDGELREVRRSSGSGHQITEFIGDPRSWMSAHAPNGQAITAIGANK